MNPIYTVTTLISFRQWHHRVWGWYPTYEQALDAVTSNRAGLDECLYDWIVIEEVPAGIGVSEKVVFWGKWNDEKSAWVESSPPYGLEFLAGFSMG